MSGVLRFLASPHRRSLVVAGRGFAAPGDARRARGFWASWSTPHRGRAIKTRRRPGNPMSPIGD